MRIFKEPLLHFILIGAALFGLYALVNRDHVPTAGMIVSRATIEGLTETFSKDWNRAPSEEELQNLIDDYIRDELAFREGVAMGLDLDDVVIRQRIRQKIELLAEEEVVKVQPTDAELEAYLAANAEVFREPEGIPGAAPDLGRIRNMVEFEWENEQRLQGLEKLYSDLRVKYGVRIEEQVE